MNYRRFLLGSAAVFLAFGLMEYVVHHQVLSGTYSGTSQLWRAPEVQRALAPWQWAGYAVFGLMFCFIYTFGLKQKGSLGQGVRYGIYVGLLLFVPAGLMRYAAMPHPVNLVFATTVFGMLECVVCGLIIGTLYRPRHVLGRA